MVPDLINACLRLGMTINDFDHLNLGEMSDIIFAFNNATDTSDKNEPVVRQATQEDFDRF